jgi:hypothetical protein
MMVAVVLVCCCALLVRCCYRAVGVLLSTGVVVWLMYYWCVVCCSCALADVLLMYFLCTAYVLYCWSSGCSANVLHTSWMPNRPDMGMLNQFLMPQCLAAVHHAV